MKRVERAANPDRSQTQKDQKTPDRDAFHTALLPTIEHLTISWRSALRVTFTAEDSGHGHIRFFVKQSPAIVGASGPECSSAGAFAAIQPVGCIFLGLAPVTRTMQPGDEN
jgi:hypothetical protein